MCYFWCQLLMTSMSVFFFKKHTIFVQNYLVSHITEWNGCVKPFCCCFLSIVMVICMLHNVWDGWRELEKCYLGWGGCIKLQVAFRSVERRTFSDEISSKKKFWWKKETILMTCLNLSHPAPSKTFSYQLLLLILALERIYFPLWWGLLEKELTFWCFSCPFLMLASLPDLSYIKEWYKIWANILD